MVNFTLILTEQFQFSRGFSDGNTVRCSSNQYTVAINTGGVFFHGNGNALIIRYYQRINSIGLRTYRRDAEYSGIFFQ